MRSEDSCEYARHACNECTTRDNCGNANQQHVAMSSNPVVKQAAAQDTAVAAEACGPMVA
jgi:hypothetical protein